MKITVDFDVTPAEARAFFGMPDVEPINKLVIDEMKKRTKDNLDTLANPERLIAQWMTMSGKGFEQFQSLFGGVATSGSGSSGKSKSGSKKS